MTAYFVGRVLDHATKVIEGANDWGVQGDMRVGVQGVDTEHVHVAVLRTNCVYPSQANLLAPNEPQNRSVASYQPHFDIYNGHTSHAAHFSAPAAAMRYWL